MTRGPKADESARSSSRMRDDDTRVREDRLAATVADDATGTDAARDVLGGALPAEFRSAPADRPEVEAPVGPVTRGVQDHLSGDSDIAVCGRDQRATEPSRTRAACCCAATAIRRASYAVSARASGARPSRARVRTTSGRARRSTGSGRPTVGFGYATRRANVAARRSPSRRVVCATPSLPYQGSAASVAFPAATWKRSTTSSKAARYTPTCFAPAARSDAACAAAAVTTAPKFGELSPYGAPLLTLPPALVNSRRTDASRPALPASSRQTGTIASTLCRRSNATSASPSRTSSGRKRKTLSPASAQCCPG